MASYLALSACFHAHHPVYVVLSQIASSADVVLQLDHIRTGINNVAALLHRSDALQGMLVLAAATQQAEGSKEAGALQQAQEAVAAAAAAAAPEHQVRGRQESVSSDYSEGQQYNAAQRTAQRGAGHHESEEEKKEKR